MRPEAWPFLGVYGVWLWRRERDRRAVLAAAAVVPLLWFGPDLFGAGGALGASNTARGVPSPGSAKLADVPVLAVLGDTATHLHAAGADRRAARRGRSAGASRGGSRPAPPRGSRSWP